MRTDDLLGFAMKSACERTGVGLEAYMAMIETAQKLATQYEIPRAEIDAFAVRSHQHAAAARDSGRLAMEIVPVGDFEHDEFIRGDTSVEALAKLPPQPGTQD